MVFSTRGFLVNHVAWKLCHTLQQRVHLQTVREAILRSANTHDMPDTFLVTVSAVWHSS